MQNLIHLISHIFLIFMLGFYMILNLQWYNYKFKRVILHHHNPYLHIIFFLFPLFAYIALREYLFIFLIPYLIIFYLWYKKIDKKLIFTARVKRFFILLFLFAIFLDLLCLAKFECKIFSTILPLASALFISNLIEKFLFMMYKKEAYERLKKINPTIIAITASYGKTSIKNFLYQILSYRYKTYATPRSVNTLGGIVKDINESLPKDTKFYIVEAGARERGDIYEIATFLNPEYVIIGKIGPQHIEYFKTIENIYATKLELLASKNLKKAFIYHEIPVKKRENFIFFGDNIKNLKEDLEKISFDLDIKDKTYHIQAPILGGFNAINLTAAIMLANELEMDMEDIVKVVKNLRPVEHRLQKIEAGGKIVIDDSFNGNFEGMINSYNLIKNYNGRKVLVTPGIVEATKEMNEKLAKSIDEIFDIVFITGKINQKILDKNIKRAKKIIVEDKSKLQDLLAKNTKKGDLILFSNDAPSYM